MPAPTKSNKRAGRINVTAAAARRTTTVPPWDRLLAEFLEQKEHLGRSHHTILYYRQRMGCWLLFLEDNGHKVTALEVTPKLVEGWSWWVRSDRKLSPNTARHGMIALRAFYTWFIHNYAEGLANPVSEAETPKVPEKRIDTFTHEQIEAMVRACEADDDFYGIRDKAMLILLLDTGVRNGELCNIQLHDINWDNQSIRIMGKGQKERTVPFANSAFVALRAYLRVRPELDHDTVFVTHFGNPLEIDRLGDVVERRAKAANVTGVRCSPHTFRHTFAVQYLLAGGDALSLQTILGHSTLEMTKRYVNFAQTMINTLHRRVSPADAIVPQVGPGRKRIDIAVKGKRR